MNKSLPGTQSTLGEVFKHRLFTGPWVKQAGLGNGSKSEWLGIDRDYELHTVLEVYFENQWKTSFQKTEQV
jgi:hypothetical protein